MTAHANLRTSVSALMGATVRDAGGRTLGHVKEFAVAPTIDAAHVQGILVRLSGPAAGWKRPSRSRHSKLTLVPIASIGLTVALGGTSWAGGLTGLTQSGSDRNAAPAKAGGVSAAGPRGSDRANATGTHRRPLRPPGRRSHQ